MAITGLTLDETWEYKCADDDGDDPTWWILGVIDAVLLAKIEDKLMLFRVGGEQADEDGSTETKLKVNERNIEIVRYGLKGYRNFKDAEGKEIPFRTVSAVRSGRNVKIVEDATIRRIPPNVLKELAEQILEGNALSEEEVKNSE
jgi:hypothetical protein